MQVEVVRSARRSRTVALRPTADGVRISIPAWSTKEEEEHYVRTLLKQYERKQKKNDVSLEQRVKVLCKRYKMQKPATIQWANMKTRWGSCTPDTGAIRISTEVKAYPQWVLDYVIMHELAHLSYYGHGVRFWAMVERYPKTERARGFLIAKGLEGLEDDNADDAPNDIDEAVDPDAPMIDLTDLENQPDQLGFFTN